MAYFSVLHLTENYTAEHRIIIIFLLAVEYLNHKNFCNYDCQQRINYATDAT